MKEKIKSVKKVRFTDLPEYLFPTPVIVPETLLNLFLEEKDKDYLKDWDEAVLVDDVFYICISRHLKAV